MSCSQSWKQFVAYANAFDRCVAVKTLPMGTDVEIECVAVL